MVNLRPWKIEDATAIVETINNENVQANLRDGIPFPYTVQDALDYLEKYFLKQPEHFFCIEFNDKVVGSIAVIPKENVYRKTAELGYYVAEPYWRKGIASKAIGLITDYAWKNLDVIKIYAEVFEYNKHSMRALEKNDFYLEGIRKKSIIKNSQLWDDYVWVKFKPGYEV